MQAAGGRWADWALGVGQIGRWALGVLGAGRRRARQASGSRRRRAGRAAAGAAGARGVCGLGAGCAACAHRLGASWASFGARAPGLVFNLVFRLGIFHESLNEPCSL